MTELLTAYILARADISDSDMKFVLSHFKPLTVQKDETLLREGEQAKRMYFIVSGCLRIYFLQADGSEATRYLAFENNFASALIAFISRELSQEYIQALETSDLLYITYTDFYSLLEKVPGWEKFFRTYLENAYITNTRRLMSFITMDATERYRLLMAEKPQVTQRLSNKMVANYLGISQEALSRLKTKLRKL